MTRYVALCLASLMLLGSVVGAAAELIEFRKVDYFEIVTNDDGVQDRKQRDARLEIDNTARTISIVHEKRGAEEATYAIIPFAAVTSVVYQAKKAVELSPLTLFRSRVGHFLTIEFDDGFADLRLDKNNESQIRAALTAAGFDVEHDY